MSRAASTDAASTHGKTARSITVTGLTIKSMAEVHISGSMGASTLANGSITTCTDMAFTHGKMEDVTRVSISRTANTAMVSISGLTDGNTMVSGRMAASTVRAPIGSSRTRHRNVAFGSRASVKGGSIKPKSELRKVSKYRKVKQLDKSFILFQHYWSMGFWGFWVRQL